MKKTVMAIVLAAVMVLGITSAAFAAGGETTVGVEVTTTTPKQVSCTVPLNVAFTVDASGENPSVIVPTDSYGIKNTSPEAAIKVSKVQVQGIAGATWSLKGTPAAAHDIKVTVGGAALPDLAAGTTIGVDAETLPTGADNIAKGATAVMALTAEVGGAKADYSTAEALADQFKIIYTIAAA